MSAARDGGVRSYYGRPVVKPPEWTWEVPWYLFVGGLSGASSTLSLVARAAGRRRLAQRARLVAGAGAVVGPALLVADLKRPQRFHHMLRVFKPTSAMSVGSWILAAYSSAAVPAAALGAAGRLPGLRALADAAAGLLGLPMATYTGVLVADSAIPVWHQARSELPPLFAASAAATAGAALVLVGGDDAEPARRLAIGGAVAELAIEQAMEQRLGEVGEVYQQGDAGRYAKTAKLCTAAGAGLLAIGRRRRGLAAAGSALVLAGGVCQRWSVYRAGFQSAENPKYVVKPQRDRLTVRASADR